MPRATTPHEHLQKARIRLSGAAVSLEHILAAETDASRDCRIEQQGPFILEELTAALDLIRRARSELEAQQAIARCEAAEAAEAEQVRAAA